LIGPQTPIQMQDIAPEIRDEVLTLKQGAFLAKPIFRSGKWQLVTLIEHKVFDKPPLTEQREVIKADLVQAHVDREIERLTREAEIKLQEPRTLEIDDAWLD